MPSRVVIALPEFEKEARRLKRRFPRVSDQVRILASLLSNWEMPGDRVPDTSNRIYKARLPNPSARRGKRGGFRVYYAVSQSDMIYLVTIYSKTDRDDVNTYEVQQRIRRMDRELSGKSSAERHSDLD